MHSIVFFIIFAFLCLMHIPLLCKISKFELIPLFFQSLEFDLIVYAPYRSIDGFVNDMEVSWLILIHSFCWFFLLWFVHQKSSFVFVFFFFNFVFGLIVMLEFFFPFFFIFWVDVGSQEFCPVKDDQLHVLKVKCLHPIGSS